MKRLLCLLLMSLMVLFSILPSTVSATKWVSSFVVWDGYVYVLSEEIVEEVEEKIGQVTVYSDMQELPGNFSNTYQKGTGYYSIKGIHTDEAIAVKNENGTFVKATREEKYGHAQPEEQNDEPAGYGKILFWVVGILGTALLIVIITIIQKRRTTISNR